MASPIILGMGNPLLDISATVTPAMLEKYGLKANDAILYEKEDLYDELLKDYKVDYIAGGATQNSCRVAQWLLPDKKSVAFFGCVGKTFFFNICTQQFSQLFLAFNFWGKMKGVLRSVAWMSAKFDEFLMIF